jgi:uncharacterized membrane protein
MRRTLMAVAVIGLIYAAAPVVASAQEDAGQDEPASTTFALTTPYIGVSVQPGESATFNVTVTGPPERLVDIGVEASPDGWATTLKGGGLVVDRVMLGAEGTTLVLTVDVPADAPEGEYPLVLTAAGGGDSLSVDLSVTVSATVEGGVSLNAQFPGLRGSADTTFSFSLELANDTSEEIQFGLDASGPDGWIITAQPSGQSRASTVTIAAGATQTITVDVDPPDATPAGQYPIDVQAVGSGRTAATQVIAEVTGNYAIAIATADQRLNVDVTAGSVSELPIVLTNTGSAPLTDLSLTSTPPIGWTVDFTPAQVAAIGPGETVQVTAAVTPSEDAVAGDYRITIGASVVQVSDQVEIRATVQTARFWGFVGIAVIALAVIGLGVMFRSFGRR